MNDFDAIEAINVDQIVTATDRLLFGTIRKWRVNLRAQTQPQTQWKTPWRSLAVVEEVPTLVVRGRGKASLKVLGAVAAIAWLTVALVCIL